MKMKLCLFCSFILLLFLSGCTQTVPSILTKDTSSSDYSTRFMDYSLDLLNYSSNSDGFSIVGSKGDLGKLSYIHDKFSTLGLSNVSDYPINLDSWEYSGLSLSFLCDCAELGILTLQKIGVHPSTFSFKDSQLEMLNVENNIQDYIGQLSGKGVILGKTSDVSSSVSLAIANDAAFIIYPYLSDYSPTSQKVDISLNLPTTIPIFVVSVSTSELFTKYIPEGSSVTATLTGSSLIQENTGGYFVLGDIEGKVKDKYIYVTANRDTLYQGFTSSNVSISEMFILIEELLSSGYTPNYTIRFLVTTGHEWGKVGKTFNVGIESYLKEQDLSSIQSVLVLDGSKPLLNSNLIETHVSSSFSDAFTSIESFNTSMMSDSYSVSNFVTPINPLNITEGLVWDSLGVLTVIQSESSGSEYLSLENSSSDSPALPLDSSHFSFLIDYYLGIIKLLNTF